jgi:predicted nucleic acid-binding protein
MLTERIAACRDPTDDKFLELAVNGHADLMPTRQSSPTRSRESGGQAEPSAPARGHCILA